MIDMNLFMNEGLAEGYRSASQKIRLITEGWIAENLYCVRCGNPHLEHFLNNKPVADFYCPLARLVIELDGSQHYTEQGMQYDMERSAVFEQYGVQVLRFRNQDVSAHFEMVCEQIHEAVVKRLEELERGKEG